jgi:hypothetical protein
MDGESIQRTVTFFTLRINFTFPSPLIVYSLILWQKIAFCLLNLPLTLSQTAVATLFRFPSVAKKRKLPLPVTFVCRFRRGGCSGSRVAERGKERRERRDGESRGSTSGLEARERGK